MSGVKLRDLPPETPFLSSNGSSSLVNQTPIMRRFQITDKNKGGQQPLR